MSRPNDSSIPSEVSRNPITRDLGVRIILGIRLGIRIRIIEYGLITGQVESDHNCVKIQVEQRECHPVALSGKLRVPRTHKSSKRDIKNDAPHRREHSRDTHRHPQVSWPTSRKIPQMLPKQLPTFVLHLCVNSLTRKKQPTIVPERNFVRDSHVRVDLETNLGGNSEKVRGLFELRSRQNRHRGGGDRGKDGGKMWCQRNVRWKR